MLSQKKGLEMSKSVGIITIYRKNYGAFLQAYSLQRTLIELGFDPKIIRYDYYKDHTLFGINYKEIRKPLSFIKMLAVAILRYKPHKQRQLVFDASIIKNIRETEEYYTSYDKLLINPPRFDVYLTGSDQVFNPRLSKQAFDARLLNFVSCGRKVSYAASAGKIRFSEKERETLAHSLKTFEIVSVREERLKDYLEKEFAIKSTKNIDPTFLLNRNQWELFANNLYGIQEDYIFYYRVQKQEELIKKAVYISDRLNLPLFVVDGRDSFPHQIKRRKDLSPEEWVGAMLRSKYVITNSFHGTAFAINLKKRMSVVIPPDGGLRILNLLENCKLNYVLSNDIMLDNVEDIYADAHKYLNEERRKAVELLASI